MARKRLYNANRPRPGTLSEQTGVRALAIVSMNPDNLITTDRQKDITREIKKRQVHIAEIQETQIPHDLDIIKEDYRIITSAARPNEERHAKQYGMYQGGVAILIHEDMQHHVHQIVRIGNRIMQAALKTQTGAIPVK